MTSNVFISARQSADCPLAAEEQVANLRTVAADNGRMVAKVFIDRPATTNKGRDRRPGQAAALAFRHSLGLLVGCRDSKWLQRCGVLYFYVRYEPMSVALLTPQSIERPSGLILHDRPPGPSRPIPPDARPLLSARYNARCNALRHLPSRQPFSSIPRRRIISGSVSIRRSIVHRRWRRRSIQERCS
jgi:hypothetical protein